MDRFKNLIPIVVLIFAIGLMPAQIDKVKSQPDRGLIAHWSFDGSGKTTEEVVTGRVDSIDYVFNQARFKPSSPPLRRPGISSNALVFDGFSTKIVRPANEFSTPKGSMSISVWVAPRAFEHGDGNKLSVIVNQHDLATKQGFALGMYRHGSWSFQFGDGDEWVEIWDEGNPIPRRKWSQLAATFDKNKKTVSLYLNGERVSQQKLNNSISINSAPQDLIIGKHNQSEQLSRLFNLNMFNGFMDELKIYNRALAAEEVRSSFESYITPHGEKIPNIPYEEIMIDPSKYEGDWHRPQFHAIPPGHWMNEPHAPIFYNGKYHLFYQHNPTGPYWHQIHWGHWVSDDMIHWKNVPEAIYPEKGDIAPDGIWSGVATYDENGDPALFYTFGNWNKVRNQGVAIALPKNIDDPDLVEWIKHPETTVTQNIGQGYTGEFRDPFVWKDEEDEKWYMIVGSGIPEKGGTAWFYESDNMYDWDLKGPFYVANFDKYPYLGPIWELPVFLPIDEYPNGEKRYMFIISPKAGFGKRADVEVYYWLGRFDKKNNRFVPDFEEPRLIDLGDFDFTGPSGMVDPKTGRTIIFTIAQTHRSPQDGYDAGWHGNAGLPVQVRLNDEDELEVEPIEETKSLRDEMLISFENKDVEESNALLYDVNGEMLEIMVEIDSGQATKFGIELKRSPGGEEKTLLYYDRGREGLLVDRTNTNQNADPSFKLKGGKLDLKGENLKLRIFIDHSLIESYANKRKSLTTRAYTKQADSNGLAIWANGDVTIKTMKVWKLNSIH